MKSGRRKFISMSFVCYLGAFGIGINLFINDKLRADMEALVNSGQKRSEMKRIHDRIAPTYDRKSDNYEVRNQYNKYRRILVSYAHGKVLECGVGTGKSLEFYKKDANVIGIDYSSKMLEQAKNKLENRADFSIDEKAKIILTSMDCEDIDKEFSNNTFDCVVDINNFQTYYDYKRVYEGIKNVLKDNGLFLFLAKGESDWNVIKEFYKYTRPYVFMKFGQDLTVNWKEVIENDSEWEVLFKDRKTYGKTYIYVLKLHKSNKSNISDKSSISNI